MKPPFIKLIEVGRALPRDHSLCDIILLYAIPRLLNFLLEEMVVLSYPAFIPQNLYFCVDDGP